MRDKASFADSCAAAIVGVSEFMTFITAPTAAQEVLA